MFFVLTLNVNDQLTESSESSKHLFGLITVILGMRDLALDSAPLLHCNLGSVASKGQSSVEQRRTRLTASTLVR